MSLRLAATDADRQTCFAIRRAVFIEEQAIPEAEEWDAADLTCLHFLWHEVGEPAGTLRLIGKGRAARIGRVAVLRPHRGAGVGARMMRAAMAEARARGFARAELSAQVTAIDFYARLGFVAEGPARDDGSGILHRLMRADL